MYSFDLYFSGISIIEHNAQLSYKFLFFFRISQTLKMSIHSVKQDWYIENKYQLRDYIKLFIVTSLRTALLNPSLYRYHIGLLTIKSVPPSCTVNGTCLSVIRPKKSFDICELNTKKKKHELGWVWVSIDCEQYNRRRFF